MSDGRRGLTIWTEPSTSPLASVQAVAYSYRMTALRLPRYCRPELSMGPFCVTRSNPTIRRLTQPNTTNIGAYSLVVAYFMHRTYLVPVFNQVSTYSCFTGRYTY